MATLESQRSPTLSILGSGTCETVQEIIDIAVTAEAFAVTALGGALESAANGDLDISDEAVQALKAARASEQVHYDVLIAAGAKPITTTFTVPDPAFLTDPAVFYPTLISLEEAFIAAYLAAAQTFVVLGEADLAKLALQIGAVEAEHRVGVRFFAVVAGVVSGLPNDVAFEKSLFTSVAQAAKLLQDLGFIGGSGAKIMYPGPGEIDYTGVKNLKP
ncbi:MAG: ferritin-like domain-containing protein [Chloroflexia bacterium]